MKKLDLVFDFTDELADDEINEIDAKVSDYYTSNSIGYNDEINQEGLVCESIIDLIAGSAYQMG